MTQEVSKHEQVRGERRQQIVKAALAGFSERGCNAANVSDVAARTGVSQGDHLLSRVFVETLVKGLRVTTRGDA